MLCKKTKELVLFLKPLICRAKKCYSYVLVFVQAVLRILLKKIPMYVSSYYTQTQSLWFAGLQIILGQYSEEAMGWTSVESILTL
jgi:hypothetical protein